MVCFFMFIAQLIIHHLSWPRWGPTQGLLLWVWVVIFAAWHDASPKALSSFSCSSNKWFPWFFDFTFGLFFAFGCIGLGFGFRPLHCLSFKSSLACFFSTHLFCFVVRDAVNFSSPFQLPWPRSIWHGYLTLILFVSIMVSPSFPWGWINWASKNLSCIDNSFQGMGRNFE